MDDLISRQTALGGLMLCDFAQDSRQYGGATVLFESSVRKMLEQIPAAQKEPGKWIEEDNGESYFYSCSKCGKRFYNLLMEMMMGEYRYCPNCGTKMDGVDDDH